MAMNYADYLAQNRQRESSNASDLRIDIVADFVCPWCYLGKRRLDAALDAVHGPRLVTWFPYQLNPEMPAEGMSMDEYLTSRFGSPDVIASGLDALTHTGRREGIRFRFDRIERVPNTLDAHRLMYLAKAAGADAGAVAEDLMSAFLSRGEDIAKRDLLVSIGEAQGLSADAIQTVLNDGASKKVVLEQEQQMRDSGIAGAPVFLVNQRYFVSGAQTVDALIGAFDRAMFGDASSSGEPEILH